MKTRACLIIALSVLAPCGALAQSAAETAAAHKSGSTPGSDWVFGTPIPGLSQYGWDWFAERYDADGDHVVDNSEFDGPRDYFVGIDTDWNGKITAADFNWSAEGSLAIQHEAMFALFKAIDKNSDGQIAADEWQESYPGDDGQVVIEEDLDRFIYGPLRRRRMSIRRMTRERMAAEYDFANPAPLPGTLAPDFELKTPEQSATVRLSDFRGKKPVVLIFGSFTCGNFRTHATSLESMSQRWGDQAEFLTVYVREAHPADNQQQATSTNARAGILIPQPTNLEQRCDVAGRCQSVLRLNATMVVDELDNAVGTAYAATPDRLYVVDRLGKVAFQGGPGPFGFTPREMEQALILTLLAEEN